ncbi:TlpA family protein disulfide reductase [Solitalea sp. MAHUQ-68]|uniref:TlpA family protein disulfide reductase n=1 Tax=Solitalea agri TaxID=2953739 RepID=A0A9X2F128_9SPHI|nr:TlpA disulfide reductase family protein [Solitalea agri]MCO4292692.1 TlpA family protein disulfide reductase [Solitalea agri]
MLTRRFFYLISILLFSSIILSAQQKPLPFKVIGDINADSGIIELQMLADSCFYPQKINLRTNVVNKKFYFEGTIAYPQPVRLIYNSGEYVGDFCIIEPGSQSIKCDFTLHREIPPMNNRSMKEYFGAYTDAFKLITTKRNRLDEKWDSLSTVHKGNLPDSIKLNLESKLNNYYKENDTTLLRYVKAHPDSYVSLWKLAHLLSFGYEDIFDSIYDQFSDSIKNTYTGKVLAQKIKKASLLSIGKRFPGIMAINNKNEHLDTGFFNHKYTLVDFWYSHCGPCREQFNDLKIIYEKYKYNGFEIISISTDKQKDKQNWLEVIEKYSLPWPQYWDIDGQEANKLFIQAFPTNVLLDSTGRIIMKNIKPAELKKFLAIHSSPELFYDVKRF